MKISKLVYEIKKDKEKFYLLERQFEPLIKKYTKLMYKDDEEDIYAELVVSLWEAICNITFYYEDGQVINYLSRAIKNKYLELYKKSRKYNDNCVKVEQKVLEEQLSNNDFFEDVITISDMNKLKCNLKGKKKEIFELSFLNGYTDTEISNILNISRQYVHKVKKNLYEMIKKQVLDIREMR